MYVMQDTHSVELGLIIAFVEFFFLTTNTKFKHMVSLDFFFTDYYTLSSVSLFVGCTTGCGYLWSIHSQDHGPRRRTSTVYHVMYEYDSCFTFA